MLRMRPTQIELNSRDHHWHNVRHVNRQKQRARGFPVEVTSTGFPYHPGLQTQEDTTSPYRFPDPPDSEESGIIAAPQMPLFSKKPDMRKFWSGVVAGAGVLPVVRSLHTAKPVLVPGPSDYASGIHSARGSIEENLSTIHDLDEEVYDDPKKVIESPGSEQGDETNHPELLGISRKPRDAGITVGGHQESVDEEESTASSAQRGMHARRLSLFPFHRHGHVGDEARSLRRRDSSLRDLDGSSDPFPMLNGPAVASVVTIAQSEPSEGSLFEKGVRDIRCVVPATLSTNPGIEHISELLRTSFPPDDAFEQSTSIYSRLPRQVDNVRRRPSVHSRSPLYISQVATSSSPEKRPRPTSNASELDVTGEMEMLSINSRRRKRYKRRSQSYPYFLSETEPVSIGFQSNMSAHISPPDDISHRPTAITSELDYTYLSPPTMGRGIHYSIVASPANTSSSATISPARRNLSPARRPLTPTHHSPYSPPLPVPPHPFSAVRRAVSFTPALPSASPSSSPAPYETPFYSNGTHFSPSVTPPPHTPNYTVYNDRLPASSQPQTPAGLSTNGFPRHGLSSVYRGAFTAPAGVTRGARQQRSRNLYDSGSPPSRRGRVVGLRLDDQENERHGLETERRWRRQASLRGTRLDLESEDSGAGGLYETWE